MQVSTPEPGHFLLEYMHFCVEIVPTSTQSPGENAQLCNRTVRGHAFNCKHMGWSTPREHLHFSAGHVCHKLSSWHHFPTFRRLVVKCVLMFRLLLGNILDIWPFPPSLDLCAWNSRLLPVAVRPVQLQGKSPDEKL